VFGNQDKWTGLGVIFDTFDNDGRRDNPSIHAIVNDGTRNYDHASDGSQTQLGSCQMNYRNLETDPGTNTPKHARVRVIYNMGTLTVCTAAHNIDIVMSNRYPR
jgi:mannose-binding lectin 1